MSSCTSSQFDTLPLEGIINRKPSIQQILYSKHILNKVKNNIKLFAKYLKKNQSYLDELMKIAFTIVKNYQQDTQQQREICHIALEILTLQQQSIAELFVGTKIGSTHSIQSCSSDSDECQEEGIYQSIYKDQQTGQIVVAQKQFSFIDPKQFQKTDKGNHLANLLNYLFEHSSDETIVNYIIEVLKSILKVHMGNKIYQFLFSEQGNGYLQKIISISYHFSVSSFLAQLFLDYDVIQKKQYLDIQKTIVGNIIALLKNSLLDCHKFIGYANFVQEVFCEYLPHIERNQQNQEIFQLVNLLVEGSLMQFFMKVLLENSNSDQKLQPGAQSRIIFENSLIYLSKICKFLVDDESQKEDQQYGQKKTQRAKYDFQVLYKNYTELVRRVQKILQVQNSSIVLKYITFLSDLIEHQHFPVALHDQQQLMEMFEILINQFYSDKIKGITLFTLQKLLSKVISIMSTKTSFSHHSQPSKIFSNNFDKLNLFIKKSKKDRLLIEKVAFAQKLAIIMVISFPNLNSQQHMQHLIEIQEKQQTKLSNFSPTKNQIKLFPHLKNLPIHKPNKELPTLHLHQKPNSSPPKLNLKKMDSIIQNRKQKVKYASSEPNPLIKSISEQPHHNQNEFKILKVENQQNSQKQQEIKESKNQQQINHSNI